jgi:hypothetical protein
MIGQNFFNDWSASIHRKKASQSCSPAERPTCEKPQFFGHFRAIFLRITFFRDLS